MDITSCLRDMPLTSESTENSERDTLSAGRYGNALAKFIRNAATPVTIGIQGGWGSGKTSLFSIIRMNLEEDASSAPLCIKVNAWEHSLFQGKQNPSQVVFSLLASITEQIQEAVEKDENLDKKCQSIIKDRIEPALRKTLRALDQYVPTLVNLATGANLRDGPAPVSPARLVNQIRELRKNLTDLTSKIRRKKEAAQNEESPPEAAAIKIVIFIDDLDRVNPATAVEILDAIKNIFDIPQCVFVLAIDYEVVVKGLESKYGERTPENEREFRQYFDKIIQVPFSMPIGSYAQAMEQMLKEAFDSLGLLRKYALDRKAMDMIISVCKLATGGNPRGIKRILNTLSLLDYISNEERQLSEANKILRLQILFIIVALHLNFPEISRLLMENNKFTSWNFKENSRDWDLAPEDRENALRDVDASGAVSSNTDEEWEQVVYAICFKSPWLRRRVQNVLKLLNMLRMLLNKIDERGNFEAAPAAAPLTDAAMVALSGILETIAVVTVDTAQESGGTEKLKYDNISRNLKGLHRILAEKNLPDVLDRPSESDYAELDEFDEMSRVYSMPCKSGPVEFLRVKFSQSGSIPEIMLIFTLRQESLNAKTLRDILRKLPASLAEAMPEKLLEDEEMEVSYALPKSGENFPCKIFIQWDQPRDGLDETGKLATQIHRLYQITARELDKLGDSANQEGMEHE